MAGIRITQLPEKLTAPEQGDFFVLDDGTTAQKVDFDTLAGAVIEAYDGATLAGTAQSVQSAFNSINSNKESVDTNGAYTTLTSGIYYIKKHGFVNVFAHKTGITLSARSWTDVATLPVGYRPSTTIYAATVLGNNGAVPAYVRVHSGGGIGLYASESISSQLVIFNVTFAVAE